MLMTWNTRREHTQVYIALPELVVVDYRKVPKFHVTAAPSSGGASHLRRAFRRVFLYIPASGGSGMQISPPDTVKKQPLGVVLQQGWREGKLSKRPQAENSTGIRPTDGSMASFLMRLGRILSPSNSQAYR